MSPKEATPVPREALSNRARRAPSASLSFQVATQKTEERSRYNYFNNMLCLTQYIQNTVHIDREPLHRF